MNTIKPLAGLASAGLVALTLSANAAAVATVPRLASDEAARCIDAVRQSLVNERTTGLHHTITRIELRGDWRAFTIRSAVFEDGEAPSRQVYSRCLADRWGSGTELKWQRAKS